MFLLLKLRFEDIVAMREDGGSGENFPASGVELLLFGDERIPGAELSEDVARSRLLDGRLIAGGTDGGAFVAGGLFVLVEGLLDFAMRIGAGVDQVLVSVVKGILIEAELGLREIELLLERVSFRIRGFGEKRSDARNVSLVRSDAGLQSLDAFLNFFRNGAERWRIQGGLAESEIEGEVHFVIAEAERVAGKILFVSGDGERSEALGGLERTLVNDRRTRRG